MKFNKITYKLQNIEGELDSKDTTLLLLSLLHNFFENYKDDLIYGKEYNTILKEVQSDIRIKKLTKMKELKIENSDKCLNVSKRGMKVRVGLDFLEV